MCCSNAALVGGIVFILVRKICCQVLLISEHVLVLSYNKITNLSIAIIASTGISFGARESFKSASVSCGNACQILHAVFLLRYRSSAMSHSHASKHLLVLE